MDQETQEENRDADLEENGAVEPGDVAAGLVIAKEFLQKIIEILSVDVAVCRRTGSKCTAIF